MIKNGDIRANTNEKVKNMRGAILGYGLLYSIISSMVISIIYSILNVITSLVGRLILGIVSTLLRNVNYDFYRIGTTILASIGNGIGMIISIAIGVFAFAFGYGLIKEILIMVGNNKKVSPVDFFSFAMKDFKRIAKAYLVLAIKYILPIVVMSLGILIIGVGGVMIDMLDDIIAIPIIVIILGVLVMIAGSIWLFVVALMYQSLPYELLYDRNNLDAKAIVKQTRENLKGYTWQYTRLNLFYAFFYSIIVTVITILFIVGLAVSTALITANDASATIISIIIMFGSVGIFSIVLILASLAFNYFTTKNTISVDELFRRIIKEKHNVDLGPINE